MTEEQAKQLSTVYRLMVGEKSNSQQLTKGLVERVTSLENWRWLLVASLFLGSATGNVLGRIWV